jgi:hypothetical protein
MELRPLSLFLVLTTLPGCIAVRETSDTYTLPATARPVVQGAVIGGEFVPTDGSPGITFSAMVVGAASGRRFGPYQFALYAAGTPGEHHSMTVHSVTFRSSRGLSDTVPSAYTGKLIPFSETLRKNTVQATWHSPGVLKFDFTADESASVTADLSISGAAGTTRRTVTLPFNKVTEKNSALLNAPAEILRHAGKDIPFEDEEIGANRRDWQPR